MLYSRSLVSFSDFSDFCSHHFSLIQSRFFLLFIHYLVFLFSVFSFYDFPISFFLNLVF